MKFDIVIGNPPYNNGLDLDFIDLGYDRSKHYCSMIVPAKWKIANGRQITQSKIGYDQLRDKIIESISDITFYPDCSDVFDIRICGGISHFLMDHNRKHDKCTIINKCSMNKQFNNTEIRKLTKDNILNNIGNEIISYVKGIIEENRISMVEIFNTCGRYQVWITDTYNSSSSGKCLFRSDGKTSVLCPSRILDSTTDRNSVDTARVIFASDNRDECESFLSWLYTKFVRFFILMAVDGFHMASDIRYYRFVPMPVMENTDGELKVSGFNHIYNDKELYKAFKLPQKYIDTIEDLIK